MKHFKLLTALCCLAFVCITVTSCSEDWEEDSIAFNGNESGKTYERKVSSSAQQTTVSMNCTHGWKIISELPSWCKAQKSSGAADEDLVLDLEANHSYERTAQIYVQAGTALNCLTLKQELGSDCPAEVITGKYNLTYVNSKPSKIKMYMTIINHPLVMSAGFVLSNGYSTTVKSVSSSCSAEMNLGTPKPSTYQAYIILYTGEKIYGESKRIQY